MSFAHNTLPPADVNLLMRYDANKRSTLVAYAVWFFLGYFGVHRFYAGRYVSGFVQLGLTLGSGMLTVILIGYAGLAIAGLWWMIDAILVPGMVQDYNNRLIASLR